MKLSELIAAVGDDNVQFQNLDRDALDVNWTAKSGTKIRFCTEVRATPVGLEKLGLVLWFDREAVKEALGL